MELCEDLSPTQLNSITELRQRVTEDLSQEQLEDTRMFYRFLKARNFNISQAESLLKRHLNYRKIFQLDTILTDYKPSELLNKYLMRNFVGFDKQHNLIGFWAVGRLDGRGILKSTNKFEVMKFCLQEIERDIELMKLYQEETGKLSKQFVYIYDLEQLNLAKVSDKYSLEVFKSLLTLMLDNYPEMLKSVYIINASVYFTFVFPIIKVILNAHVLEKLKIFGKEGWKEALLKEIDADVLPAYLGGNRTDPDGNSKCETILSWAGKIPTNFYLRKNICNISSMPGVGRKSIPRSSTGQVEIEVNVDGTTLAWEFETENYDIGFKIYFKDVKRTLLLPMYKYDTELEPMRGHLKCKQTGTYIIEFDNTYSWLHAKEVFYRTWLIYPDENKKGWIIQ